MTNRNRANSPAINAKAFSGAVHDVIEAIADQATAFVKLWRGLADNDDDRYAIVDTWPAIAPTDKRQPPGALDMDSVWTLLVTQTEDGKEFLASIKAFESVEKPSPEQRTAKEYAESTIRKLVTELKRLKRVIQIAHVLRRNGFDVTFSTATNLSYKPICIANVVEEKDPKNPKKTRTILRNAADVPVAEFLTWNPDKVKPGVKVPELRQKKNRITATRKPRAGQSPVAAAAAPVTNAVAAIAGGKGVGKGPEVKPFWNDIVPALATLESTLKDVALPQIAANGLNDRTPGYDVARLSFKRLGDLLVRAMPEPTKKLWNDLYSRLPSHVPSAPAKAVDSPALVPAPAPEAMPVILHKANKAKASKASKSKAH